MKVALISSLWRRRVLVITAIGSLLLAAGLPVLAASGDSTNEALVAARAWMTQIDDGNYTESYDAACSDFHHKVTEKNWVVVLKAIRPIYGAVVSRREVSHVYKEDGVNGLDGECVVINYNTTFSRLQAGYEQVIVKLEDGKWRGAYYEAGPKPSDQAASGDQPEVQTEVNTVKTQHPSQ